MIIRLIGMFLRKKPFPDGSFSNRIMVPATDGCRAMVTEFHVREGFVATDLSNETDVFVRVLEGSVRVRSAEGIKTINKGGSYYTRAGETFSLIVPTDSILLCVYLPGEDGALPKDE